MFFVQVGQGVGNQLGTVQAFGQLLDNRADLRREGELRKVIDTGLYPHSPHFANFEADPSGRLPTTWHDLGGWEVREELTPEQAWVEEKALCTLNEARKARGMEELEWGDCPIDGTTMGAYMQNQLPDDEPPQPDSDSPEDGDDLAKSFGLPVFRVEP